MRELREDDADMLEVEQGGGRDVVPYAASANAMAPEPSRPAVGSVERAGRREPGDGAGLSPPATSGSPRAVLPSRDGVQPGRRPFAEGPVNGPLDMPSNCRYHMRLRP